LGFPGKPRHALRDISLEADTLLFAVITDIDAGLDLLFDNVAHGAIHFEIELRFVDGDAFFAGDEERGERFVAWKAADVGGKDAAGGHVEKTILISVAWVF
jgi:hypothetical protein